jgi:hypothetical protein
MPLLIDRTFGTSTLAEALLPDFLMPVGHALLFAGHDIANTPWPRTF